MKRGISMIALVLAALIISGCYRPQQGGAGQGDSAGIISEAYLKSTDNGVTSQPEKAASVSGAPPGIVDIAFDYTRISTIKGNQFAVWIEDVNGKFIKTVFVTQASIRQGWIIKTNTVPTWVEKSGFKLEERETVDGATGATPKTSLQHFRWDCTDADNLPVPSGEYRYVVEGTLYYSSRVLFTGTIVIGNEANKTEATADYTNAGDEYREMILKVSASFTPTKCRK